MSSVSVRVTKIENIDGWLKIYLLYKNNSAKTIKYATFKYSAINKVGDVIARPCSFRFTGPLKPGRTESGNWEDVWPDYAFHHVRLEYAYIQYMDGTEETISGASVDSKGACYVATAIYGSYDCPQVWTLRRYRDNFLSKTVCGYAFIKIYYRISPFFVRVFGNSKWFNSLGRNVLDHIVKKLNEEGVENTQYNDFE